MRFLADDLLEGRGTGTRGYDLAAQYVAAQFESMGLEPAGLNGTFFQPIRFRSVLVVPEQTSLKLVRSGREENLAWGQDYVAAGDPRATVSSVRGPVVFVGHGVTAPDLAIDDYQGADVRGKIVAFMAGAPSRLPSAERAHYSSARIKLDDAAARGAIGALQLRDATLEQVSSFARNLRESTQPSMSWLDQDQYPNGRRTDIRVVAVLSEAGTRKVLGSSLPPESSVTLPVEISARTASTHSDVMSANVVAMVRGSDPSLREEYVIYTAHVDHVGIGEPVNGDPIYNGATDNAGSVAALIEIARAFKRLDQPQRRSVLFLGVTGEEKVLLGSDYFAEFPTVPRAQIVANINMDGTNLLFDFLNIVDIGGDHSSLGTVFRRAAAKLEVEAVADPTPEQNFFVRSDHYSFVRRGIPALFPIPAKAYRSPAIFPHSTKPSASDGSYSCSWSRSALPT